jgi:hypothetical protein
VNTLSFYLPLGRQEQNLTTARRRRGKARTGILVFGSWYLCSNRRIAESSDFPGGQFVRADAELP